MLEVALLVLLGFLIGGFGTLVGAGGGFILVPVLLFIYPDTPPETITAMSLFVVLGNAGSGTFAYWRQGRVDLQTGVLFALATVPGAIAGSSVVRHIDRGTFDIVFAAVLATVGTYLLVRRNTVTIRQPLTGRGLVHRNITDRAGHTFAYTFNLWQGMAISAGVGFMSSVLGIGGGIVHVPVMAVVLHFPVHIATATSHFVLAMIALEATIVHIFNGTLGWNDTLANSSAIMVGAVAGAQVGARLARHLHGDHIVRALGGALVLVAIRLAISQL